jgi:hypothetical protein
VTAGLGWHRRSGKGHTALLLEAIHSRFSAITLMLAATIVAPRHNWASCYNRSLSSRRTA